MCFVYSDPVGAKCGNFWCYSRNGTRCSWKGLKKWLIPPIVKLQLTEDLEMSRLVISVGKKRRHEPASFIKSVIQFPVFFLFFSFVTCVWRKNNYCSTHTHTSYVYLCLNVHQSKKFVLLLQKNQWILVVCLFFIFFFLWMFKAPKVRVILIDHKAEVVTNTIHYKWWQIILYIL